MREIEEMRGKEGKGKRKEEDMPVIQSLKHNRNQSSSVSQQVGDKHIKTLMTMLTKTRSAVTFRARIFVTGIG